MGMAGKLMTGTQATSKTMIEKQQENIKMAKTGHLQPIFPEKAGVIPDPSLGADFETPYTPYLRAVLNDDILRPNSTND